MKKPRADSRLKTLAPKAQRDLWDFLQKPGNGYAEGIPFVKTTFGIDTSEAALSSWFNWYPFSAQLDQYQKLRAEVQQALESNPNLDLDSEEVSKASQAIFENLAARTLDPKLFISLRQLRQKDRDQEATDRRLKIFEAREEKAKKVLSNEKLTAAQREERMRAVFGLAPKNAADTAATTATAKK